jgi:hypothetical protein
MQFKCSCGAVFMDIQQLANHKRLHQSAPVSNEPGVTCLGCAKRIPLEASKMNYSGPLPCPSCGKVMSVVIEKGDVCAARLG